VGESEQTRGDDHPCRTAPSAHGGGRSGTVALVVQGGGGGAARANAPRKRPCEGVPRTAPTPYVGVGRPISHDMLWSCKIEMRTAGPRAGPAAGLGSASYPQPVHTPGRSGAARGMLFRPGSKIARPGARGTLPGPAPGAPDALHRAASPGLLECLMEPSGDAAHSANRGARGPGDLLGTPQNYCTDPNNHPAIFGCDAEDRARTLARIPAIRHMGEVARRMAARGFTARIFGPRIAGFRAVFCTT
jgi:hypothetical protein